MSNPLVRDALRRYQAGDVLGAEMAAQQAIRSTPRDVEALVLLARIALERGDYDEAESMAAKAGKQAKYDPRPLCLIGSALAARGQMGRAIAQLEAAWKRSQRDEAVVAAYADLLEREQRRELARRLVAPIVEAGSRDVRLLCVHARLQQAEGQHESVVELAERMAPAEGTWAREYWPLVRLAAVSLEALGEYPRAFQRFHQAAEARRVLFNPEVTARRYAILKTLFTRSSIARMAKSDEASETAVFVVGMPRSGSTLIEQIIQSHPKAHGSGEVSYLRQSIESASAAVGTESAYPGGVGSWSAEIMQQTARKYLKMLTAGVPRAVRIVDKMLHNYERLGMIELLLPSARVIHARRDPMDMLFSCYTHALSPVSHPYAADLEHLGRIYGLYDDLMAHWRAALNVRILDVPYESLVDEPEAWSRRLIEFVGLPWDDACLRPHESRRTVTTLSYDQVRRPVYPTSVQRWRHYERQLEPLRTALGDPAAVRRPE